MREMVFATSLLLVGCGSSAPLTCDLDTSANPKFHQCEEIIGQDASDRALSAQQCTKIGGVLLDSCPMNGEFGSCKVDGDGFFANFHFYSELDDAGGKHEATCTQVLKGTWTQL